jgi:peptidoglycan pentaglycine glycine transferase (the first glycine)
MLEVSVSRDGTDHEWDAFLETRPDGCYQQSSLWARGKAAQGWKPLRLVVKNRGEILGGVQALLRPLPLLGAAGYVSKGPVTASGDPVVEEFVLDQLDRVARAEHILSLKVQPPRGSESVVQRLLERGARPSTVTVTPPATWRLDLRPDPEDILAQMHRTARYNIRRAERKGVIVRVGTEADIPTFERVRKIHAERRGYGPAPRGYYRRLWSIFGDHYRIFLAEYEGQVLAVRSNIIFGDIVYAQHLVDNGLHRNLNAPSLLHWKAMQYGKERGCTWYDFGGIEMHIARAIMNDEPISDTKAGRAAEFKRSFGGQLVLRPRAYDVSYLWPRRLTVCMIPTLMGMKPVLGFLIGGSLARHVRMRDKIGKKATASQ